MWNQWFWAHPTPFLPILGGPTNTHATHTHILYVYIYIIIYIYIYSKFKKKRIYKICETTEKHAPLRNNAVTGAWPLSLTSLASIVARGTSLGYGSNGQILYKFAQTFESHLGLPLFITKIFHFNGISHYKPFIFGHPHDRKPPFPDGWIPTFFSGEIANICQFFGHFITDLHPLSQALLGTHLPPAVVQSSLQPVSRSGPWGHKESVNKTLKFPRAKHDKAKYFCI